MTSRVLKSLRGQGGCVFNLRLATVARVNLSMHAVQSDSLGQDNVNPYDLVQHDLKDVDRLLREEIVRYTDQPGLRDVALYYIDGHGKAIRPMLVMLASRAFNIHVNGKDVGVKEEQRDVALASELLHTASLVHDDMLDQSELRRDKKSVNQVWNSRQVAMGGVYMWALCQNMVSRTSDSNAGIACSGVLKNLVKGELMQLGLGKEKEDVMFQNYIAKSFYKTGSLIAYYIKAAAIIAGCDKEFTDIAFNYGRNIGIAFQLVDDVLDFEGSSLDHGKMSAVDMKLGLATGPVLFAVRKFPELRSLIARRFSRPGDVERAQELVRASRGVQQTRDAARRYCGVATRLAQRIAPSEYQQGLQAVAEMVLNRRR